MTKDERVFVYLPGASGIAPDLSLLNDNNAAAARFISITYPGWQRYAVDNFLVEDLIKELSEQIMSAVPKGPIRLVGMSLGGHFAYAVALRLEVTGRDVAGICAIDSFFVDTDAPSAGWINRAYLEARDIIVRRRASKAQAFVRSKFWRSLLRLSTSALPRMLRMVSTDKVQAVLSIDPVLELELSMRLLLRATTPWLLTLDLKPSPVLAQASLLRTSQAADIEPHWRARCPHIDIRQVSGTHHTLFDAENISSVRAAFIATTQKWH